MSGREIALVGVGGAIGTLMRYGAIRAFPIEPGSFPTTILVVNLIASIALGYLLAVLAHRPDLRTLLVPGVVGGFGTLSLVAVEVVKLWDDGHALTSVTYLLATVAGGIVFVIAGLALGRHPILRPPMPEEDML